MLVKLVTNLNEYEPIAGKEVVSQLYRLAERLGPRSLMHINSTSTGGGVAEFAAKCGADLESIRHRNRLGGDPGRPSLL